MVRRCAYASKEKYNATVKLMDFMLKEENLDTICKEFQTLPVVKSGKYHGNLLEDDLKVQMLNYAVCLNSFSFMAENIGGCLG